MADDPKSTLALLNGIARRNYYGDKDITDSFLKDEIYPDLPEDQFNQLLSRCSSLLKVAYCRKNDDAFNISQPWGNTPFSRKCLISCT